MLVCHIVALLVCAFSLALNSLLIYGSFKTTSRSLGSYGYYMQASIFLNWVYSFIYTTALPVLSQNNYAFIVAAAGPIRNQHYVNQMNFMDILSTLIICSCFIYRYKILCVADTASPFQRRLSTFLEVLLYSVAVLVFQSGIYVCLQPTPELTQALYPLTLNVWELKLNESGYVGGMLHTGKELETSTFVILILAIVVYLVTCSVCFGCSAKIIQKLKSETISEGTKRLNSKMFKVLIYQILVPTFTSFVPTAIPIVAFIMGWEPPTLLLYITIASNSSCPMLNGIIIFKFVSGYRRCIVGLFGETPTQGTLMSMRTSRSSNVTSS